MDPLPGGRGQICPECAGQLSPVREPACFLCGKELTSENGEYCGDCRRQKKSFVRNFPVFNYTDAASRSMAAIKYKNRREFLPFYQEAIRRRYGMRLAGMSFQAVIPVPIHPSRRRERGFNQAELLAEDLAAYLQIPCLGQALLRTKKTLPQKILSPQKRAENLREAFAAGQIPAGLCRVLLVDDIYTTGATLEACSRVLLASGIREVYTLTLFIGGKRS